jgi:hypothetical protein
MLEECDAARGWQDGVLGDVKLRELDIEYAGRVGLRSGPISDGVGKEHRHQPGDHDRHQRHDHKHYDQIGTRCFRGLEDNVGCDALDEVSLHVEPIRAELVNRGLQFSLRGLAVHMRALRR